MKKIRLRTELSLSFAIVVAVTVFLVSILAGTFINREFEEYVKQTQKEKADELADSIGSHYGESGDGWNIDYVHGMGMYALKDGYIIKLFDSDKNTLWDAENHDMALCHEIMEDITFRMNDRLPNLEGDFVSYTYELKSAGRLNGFLEISYYTPFYLDENEFQFISSLNRILGIVGVVSLFLAALFGIIMAGRISEPILGVISATGKIAEGNYGVRVRTEAKERETFELAESVNHMAAALKEQEYLKRQLSEDIAHELRTPVTNISSYMEMMIDGVMEPTQERLKNCYEELSRLSGLVSDIERLHSAESDDLRLNLEDVDVYALAETILKSFETVLKEKNIEAKMAGEETIVTADKGRMSQVIANLLSNAVKYTDAFGKITVSVKHKTGSAEIMVKDTGIGIEKEDRSRIFERFYRTDKSRTRKTGGVGIGLSISAAIVKAHHGNIWCESEPGIGSSFFVTLPLKAASEKEKS